MKRIVALLLVLVMVLLPGCRKADRWEEAVDRGRSHLLAEEFMEAIEAFKEAIGIDPDRPEAYKFRGDAWLELAKQALEEGEFEDAEDYLDEAEDDYDRAERRDYDDPDALLAAMKGELAAGRYEKRTVTVTVTLNKAEDGEVYADRSEEAVRALYGGLIELDEQEMLALYEQLYEEVKGE